MYSCPYSLRQRSRSSPARGTWREDTTAPRTRRGRRTRKEDVFSHETGSLISWPAVSEQLPRDLPRAVDDCPRRGPARGWWSIGLPPRPWRRASPASNRAPAVSAASASCAHRLLASRLLDTDAVIDSGKLQTLTLRRCEQPPACTTEEETCGAGPLHTSLRDIRPAGRRPAGPTTHSSGRSRHAGAGAVPAARTGPALREPEACAGRACGEGGGGRRGDRQHGKRPFRPFSSKARDPDCDATVTRP